MFINPIFRKAAIQAAKKAGKILKKNFGHPLKISYKEDLSFISNVDIEVEKAVIKLLKKNFPSHNILSEEKGGRVGEEYTWVIDPLDGTTNYIKNFPIFSVSIGLIYKNEPILGVVFNPISKKLYWAEKGRGSYLNGKRIKVSQQEILSKSDLLLARGRAEEDFINFHKILGKLGKSYRTFRTWGATSLELCQVAWGKMDGVVAVGGRYLWDYAAGILIIKEAGGKVTNFEGNEWEIETKNVVATNGKIHKQIIDLLKYEKD